MASRRYLWRVGSEVLAPEVAAGWTFGVSEAAPLRVRPTTPQAVGGSMRLRLPTRMPQVVARHVEQSLIMSVDDAPGAPDDALIGTALKAIELARTVNLEDLAARDSKAGGWIRTWPGEHYRLLAGLVQAVAPLNVVEIGTATGASALAMLRYLGPAGSLTTYDLIRWQDYPGSILKAADFATGQLVQKTDDLTQPATFNLHRDKLRSADLFFVDAAKDGAMEPRLLELLATLHPESEALVVLDDIRVANMLSIWRAITFPKLDLTSFGHWSGTGLFRLT